jgi:DNA invertase Pin-like site-specific DNA recombinase
MRIGYARVSTADQHPETQEIALRAAGCERVYTDKASGKLASRPELDKALDALREGDTLVITRLDRLGRSLPNLLDMSQRLADMGVALVVIEQGIDTTTAAGRLFYSMIGAFAEFERSLIVERTHEGLATARARGRVGGRKPVTTAKIEADMLAMYDAVGHDGKRAHTVSDIAAAYSVSRPVVYRAIERQRARQS